jgi:hypothetical protein
MTDDEARAAAERLAAYLIGTCTSFAMACESLDIDEGVENNRAFCARFDELTFICGTCGWWFAVDEMSDAVDECTDCNPDTDD